MGYTVVVNETCERTAAWRVPVGCFRITIRIPPLRARERERGTVCANAQRFLAKRKERRDGGRTWAE